MIALVQRVTEAKVQVAGVTVGAIATGLPVLVCVEPADSDVQAARLVDKLLQLRTVAGKTKGPGGPLRTCERCASFAKYARARGVQAQSAY